MSLDIKVTAYVGGSSKHRKMVKVAQVCEEAGISFPHEVEAYFKTNEEIDILGRVIPITEGVKQNGTKEIIVELDLLPHGVNVLRFYTY